MNIVEKYLSAAKLKDEPKKKLSFKIKDGSITMDKLSKDLRTFINTGKTVRIDELDTMTDVKHAMTDAPSVYTVINNLPITTTTVGLLVMFSDSLGHCITQLLFTHYIVRDGVLQIGEHDHRLHIYTRNYMLRAPQEGETVNEWTKWFVINKGTLTHMSQYYKSLPYSTIEAREDTIDSAIGKLEGGYASLNTGKQNALKAYSENGQVGRNATAGIYAGEITFTTVGKDGQYDMSIPTMHLQNGKAYYGTSIDDGSEIAVKSELPNANNLYSKVEGKALEERTSKAEVSITDLQNKISKDTVVTTTYDSYSTGLLNFVPDSDGNKLESMAGGNMAGPIKLHTGDILATSARTDIGIYKVTRDSNNEIATGCAISKLTDSGNYAASGDVEILLYDTKGTGMHDTGGNSFVRYSIARNEKSIETRLKELEAVVASLSGGGVSFIDDEDQDPTTMP